MELDLPIIGRLAANVSAPTRGRFDAVCAAIVNSKGFPMSRPILISVPLSRCPDLRVRRAKPEARGAKARPASQATAQP